MRKLEIALEQTIENSNLAWQAKTEDEMKSYRKKADKIIVKAIQNEVKHNISAEKARSMWEYIYETHLRDDSDDMEYVLAEMYTFIKFVDQLLD